MVNNSRLGSNINHGVSLLWCFQRRGSLATLPGVTASGEQDVPFSFCRRLFFCPLCLGHGDVPIKVPSLKPVALWTTERKFRYELFQQILPIDRWVINSSKYEDQKFLSILCVMWKKIDDEYTWWHLLSTPNEKRRNTSDIGWWMTSWMGTGALLSCKQRKWAWI